MVSRGQRSGQEYQSECRQAVTQGAANLKVQQTGKRPEESKLQNRRNKTEEEQENTGMMGNNEQTAT